MSLEEISLKDKVGRLLDSALGECSAHASLKDLAAVIASRRNQLAKPMRVAFVGKTNAGKSTMMNAFLGEEVAPTGNTELTFNVSWFKYGEQPKLLVHTVDGGVEEEDFANLSNLAVRCSKNPELVQRIRYIEVFRPHPLLKVFDLIDTPGLHSFYEKDSKNTSELLADPENRPDAVVFLFSGTLQAPDMAALEQLHRDHGNLMTGLTALGVLTKFDGIAEWEKAFEQGHAVVRGIQDSHPETRRIFYAMIPAIGAAGFGAQVLSVEHLETIGKLAALPGPLCNKVIRDTKNFCEKEYPEEPAVPPSAARKDLFNCLGGYGIRFAIRYLNEGNPIDGLARDLAANSNVPTLRQLVTAHFGGRAYLIKSRAALGAIREAAFDKGQRLSGAPMEIACRIASAIDAVAADELRYREFTVLERYYQGTLDLNDAELRQLLDLTGEHGSSCAARLGKPAEDPIEQLVALAAQRQRYWREAAYRPFASLETQETARILAESFSAVHQRLARAAEHLQAARSLLAYEL